MAMDAAGCSSGRADREPMLPPGFRFHPTDNELIECYLIKKVENNSFSVRVIGDVDLNKNEPWELPEKAKMGEKEWYFFTLRDRKYPTGMRTNRATEAGYWKATGKDRDITRTGSTVLVGAKKTLVFYRGRAPKGVKTNWIMHEYRLEGEAAYLHNSRTSKDSEWVVCRIFQKSPGGKKTVYSKDSNTSASTTSNNNNNNNRPSSSNLCEHSDAHSSLPPLLESPPHHHHQHHNLDSSSSGLDPAPVSASSGGADFNLPVFKSFQDIGGSNFMRFPLSYDHLYAEDGQLKHNLEPATRHMNSIFRQVSASVLGTPTTPPVTCKLEPLSSSASSFQQEQQHQDHHHNQQSYCYTPSSSSSPRRDWMSEAAYNPTNSSSNPVEPSALGDILESSNPFRSGALSSSSAVDLESLWTY